MPEHEIRLVTVAQLLEEDSVLVEALLLPEVSCYGDDLDRLRSRLVKHARQLLEKMPAHEVSRRTPPVAVRSESVRVVVDPVRPELLWREPLTLTFPIVVRGHEVYPASGPRRGSGTEEASLEAVSAFVPALQIEVVAESEDALGRLLPRHIGAALKRLGPRGVLELLLRRQRCRELRVEERDCLVSIPTPRQAARAEEEQEKQEKPVLPEVGRDLCREPLPPAFEMDETVRRLAEVLGGRRPRSVLLVGPSGVGKTAVVAELVRRRGELGLGATPFWETSGARLVAGMSGFGMWEERCERLWREAARSKAVLHLGSLMELVEVGKSELRGQGVAAFFRPYLARGDLLAIAECTPEQLSLLERQDPHLLATFVQLPVEEPDDRRGRAILEHFVAAQRNAPEVAPDALATVDRLHRRYATYSAYPSRPLRFLRNLLRDRPPGQRLSPEDVTAAFSAETGLPRMLLEPSLPLDLEKTRQFFAERVIGQDEAVGLVVDLLATVKAGLSRPRKPIASLLFIGPTGVGKTEMARSLAEFLFGDPRRLTRLDMSEYADPQAVQRLIGTGYCDEGLLTARLREQPFSVVLLDEFEKAHPQLFDLLLQVLGEGRLTDAGGRLADFSNAVVILTSNLGAESYQRGVFGLAQGAQTREQARDHFVHEVQSFLRPELFNRLDRIVAFAPLDEDTTLRICHRQLDLLRRRDGIHLRSVALDLVPEVAAHLARRGHDARYGARPLKRTIERELLAPLAEQMNRYAGDAALDVRVTVADGGLQCAVRARVGATGRQLFTAGAGSAAADLSERCLTLRRNVQALARCPDVQELLDAIALLRHNVRRWQHRATRSPEQLTREAELAALARHEDALKRLGQLAAELEDQMLLHLYGPAVLPGASADEPDGAAIVELVESSLAHVERQWKDVLLGLYARRFSQPDFISVALFCERFEALFELAEAYVRLATERRAGVTLWQFLPPPEGRSEDDSPERRLVLAARDFFNGQATLDVRDWDKKSKALRAPTRADARAGVIGVLLAFEGPGIHVLLGGESGLHDFQRPNRFEHCLVDTSELRPEKYQPPEGVARRGALGHQPRRRLYHEKLRKVQDVLLDREIDWPRQGLFEVLGRLLDERLWREAQRMVSP
jgi:ATP-dependent Clp protease ATP-binding subunit ClpA